MNGSHPKRLIAASLVLAAPVLSVSCGFQGADQHRPMSSQFQSWLTDHTAKYVTLSQVSCPDLTGEQTETTCQFTGEIAAMAKIPADNGLGLSPQSKTSTTLHDFTCTVRVDNHDQIDLVRCPTSIGWIFVNPPKKPAVQ